MKRIQNSWMALLGQCLLGVVSLGAVGITTVHAAKGVAIPI